jgi:hypothetical protein
MSYKDFGDLAFFDGTASKSYFEYEFVIPKDIYEAHLSLFISMMLLLAIGHRIPYKF